ncbi:TIGR03564 family F420-dependent LLM class oxidoreductase [Amycolatopsis sp. SID8362]|uniref:TIGR03564 family F420-dependent LLM class oxidoreductase n=1 Tax=Amycolatopsis sp. SID8362 TaxID=2690346 RepID=UPI00136CEE3C|nr:TIGR03564 family F420-dependent LLM class oxidoreductase [Amycolatopsis sp. SID8362]NBH01676.1 TIGR03564 family F420-dependent LLM class oxidoreductase [Amycolatopsis sp. SID8362]NED38377.1 TIGR03564 family F420-dependent LLM class oxidoreductase [Amycolatopsis sp. SID8362]
MTIGVTLPAGDTGAAPNLVDELIAQTRQAADAGLKSVWFSQLPLSQDAITVAALAGRAVPGIEVGTSVVPTYPRHPLLVASAAQTAQAATGGRFTLGIGLGSKGFLGPVYGVEYPPPIRHLREYLTVLRQVFDGETVDFHGETLEAHPPGPSTVGGDVRVIVAAMGPQALRVTGELADGTLPFLAGPRALSEQIVPHLPAGKRILAAVPAIVTDEPDAVRALAFEQMAFYHQIPSYQRILAAEGVEHAAELALIGDEKTVLEGLQRYYDAGATDVLVSQTGIRSAEERLRTWEVVSSAGS